MSRKEFLKFCAIFGVSSDVILKAVGQEVTGNAEQPKFDLKLWYIRHEDLLDLEIGFINIKKNKDNPGGLSKIRPGSPSYMVVRLPQMHIAEATFTDDEADFAGADNQMVSNSYISGFSYIAFLLEKDSQRIAAVR